MLKLALLSTAACLLLVGLPQETRGGMLPGRGHNEKYFMFYLYEKALGRCYGDAYIRESEKEIRTVYGKCMMDIYNWKPEATEPKEEAPAEKQKRSTDESNNEVAEEKPDPFYSADFVRPLKDEVFQNAKIVACLFDHYNLTVSVNGTVDGSDYIATFSENPNISDELKGFFVPSAKECERKSVYGNYMIWGEKYANFHKMLEFYRCVQGEIYGACIKQDLKNSASDYDLSGLDGELSDVDDITRRYFISSSYANWDRTGLWDQ